MMIEAKRPCPASGYHLEKLDGELVLFHPVQMKIMHLNQSSALIWQLCDGRRTTNEIIQLLSRLYPNAAAKIKSDVPHTLQTFVAHGAMGWG